MDGLVHIEIDGTRYTAHPATAEGGPCRIDLSRGGSVELWPLTLGAYLRVLERHVTVQGAHVTLAQEALGNDLLDAAGRRAEGELDVWPLGLYWATRGGNALVKDDDGCLCGDGVRARLRPWTFAQRAAALSDSLEEGADGTQELRLWRYLLALLRATIVMLEPPLADVAELPSALGIALLNEAVSACVHRGAASPALSDVQPLHRAMAARTLSLCQALGWTPSQVWGTPAAEIDQLITLMQISRGEAQPRLGRSRGLADLPDAVVIQFEDA